uniref:Uncharacterized protein n=1 Tax=Rhizophora mucronata TaxID=61149 RepID=A0A2P2P4V2_RHIMU
MAVDCSETSLNLI